MDSPSQNELASGAGTAPTEAAPEPFEALRTRLGGRALVLFDGVCHVCNGTVSFVLKRDPEGRFAFAPLQSELGRGVLRHFGLPEDRLETMVLVEGDECVLRSTAVLRIARGLRTPWSLLYALVVVPRVLRDWGYGVLAARRYRWFGKRHACAVPAPQHRDRFLT